MLREIDQDIWVAEQSLRYFGLSVGTRMTVIRLANKELTVISPIQVSDGILKQLNKLGSVRHIVAPNLYHYRFTTEFKRLYPDAIFWAAPGLKAKQSELSIDQVIEGDTKNIWNGLEYLLFSGFRTLSLTGFDLLNECIFFHQVSHTLILTDAAFHFDESFPMATQLVTQIIGGYKSLTPSLLEKIATTDKKQVRQSVEQVLNWNFDRVIMAHGSIVEQDGKAKFKRGYEQFLS